MRAKVPGLAGTAPAVQPGQGDSATRSSKLLHTAVSHSIFSPSISSAAERISAILQQEEMGDQKWPPLFVQLNELFSAASGLAWRETARWIKFEEKVEDGGERWSTPHVPVLYLHSLFELRMCLQEGTVLLDLDAHSFKEIIEKALSAQPDVWDPELQDCLAALLLCQPLHRTTTAPLRVLTELSLAPCREKAKSCPEPRTQFSETPLKEQLRNQFKKKLLPGAEVASVMVGEVDFLKKPFPVFLRLREAVTLGSLAEVALPSRFLFILLGPQAKAKAYHEIGRAMATLLTDELFQRIAWQAKHQEDLIAGIDEFLDELTVLPPGKWDPSDRIPPPRCLSSPNKRISMHLREWKSHCNGNTTAAKDRPSLAHLHTSEELERTGRLFGGLIQDIRRKAYWYRSDFSDAMHIQCLSAVLYIYLATVTNAITFGGMLGDATANMQGVLESFLGTAFAGSIFCLFSGQPLTILSSTGPVLVFERLLFSFSEDYGLDYLEFRLWIGLWVAFFGLVLVATEASHLVQYFTRFTEEGFCALISLIFIYDSLKKMLSLAEAFPINWHYRADDVTLYSCTCNLSVPGHVTAGNNTLSPPTTTLQQFRKLVSDFSIILAILIFCAIDAALGLETPKLLVPRELKPTNPMRGWIVFPFGANPWWICLASVVPAILVTILIFMDQQITAVILNRKEYKLQKGAGFHLDFLCVSLLMIVTSVMGLPWYVSATVISLAHMESLRKESTASAPGEQPEFLGIREQRLTGLVVFILTGVSVFMAPILKYIPMPVLYGVFLHMGVAALNSIQFTDRVRLLLMPAKHQPDHLYLRHVPLRRVHLFTFIQLLCLAILWVIKSTAAAIVFPVMLLALVGIRKALEFVFSLHDLSWLDNIMPAAARKEAEGKPHRKQEEQESNTDDESELMHHQGREINISVN
ncbi:anion exchange protein 4 isoform X2 [Centrocercus urophasianus]|uniref:anion exchange protein 4 isoform X2 n=1 Tax=Centrocercus urophasianus TaxID=9002 RepID=UPI001C651266|nr:anion exchange protein 4 isoform X2 [Centrocercus urophasianus]